MMQFLYRLQPARPEMLIEGPTLDESTTITEHFHYLVRLAEAGTVHLFGRTLNTDPSSFGLVIFEAPNESVAREIMESDPAVQAGVMRAALFPYRIAGVGPGLREMQI